MIERTPSSNLCRCLIGALVALAVTGTQAAEPAASASDVRVTLVAGYYAIGAAQFADIAGVESWLRARDGRVVAIERCASADTPQLVAAVARLDSYTRDSLEVLKLQSGTPACASAALPSPSAGFVGFLRAEDYTVTDAEGRSAIP
jgi:hypothetical protein